MTEATGPTAPEPGAAATAATVAAGTVAAGTASAGTPQTGHRRRDMLRGLLAAGIGAGAGAGVGLVAGRATAADGTSSQVGTGSTAAGTGTGESGPDVRGVAVDAAGIHQAGIVRPGTPQPHGLLMVLDLNEPPGPDDGFRDTVRALCARLGTAILGLTSGERTEEAGLLDGGGDLTATVGLGPRVIAAFGAELPGGQDLPVFIKDESVPPERTGGDLLIAVYGSDPNDVHRAAHWLATGVAEASVRWSQRGFRAPGTGTIARNPLGFHDGVIVPHDAAEQDEHVWIPDGPFAGGSVCVVRRLRLDVAGFTAESVPHQERIIGRRRHDGSPLSGGGPTDEVNLLAKTPDGQYVTPADAHVRAAHPSFTGSHLMLRRGYAFDDGGADSGLLFICFQRDLRTFVQTQFRLDEVDALGEYVTPTGSATFLILPGFDPDRPLGATLP